MFKRLRAYRRRLAVAGILLLAYALAGFLLVPHVARKQVEQLVAEQLKRRIEIAESRFNPFTLGAEISGLKLTEADGSLVAESKGLRIRLPDEIAQRLRRHGSREVTLGIDLRASIRVTTRD